jgi:hypothetical protein
MVKMAEKTNFKPRRISIQVEAKSIATNSNPSDRIHIITCLDQGNANFPKKS